MPGYGRHNLPIQVHGPHHLHPGEKPWQPSPESVAISETLPMEFPDL